MTAGYPDWTRAIRLLAIDGDGNLVTILVDADGRMYSRIMAEETDGTLQVVRVDSDGQIIMVPRGSTGNYMAVDASGNLTTIMKGLEGANLRTLVVDDAGNLIAVMKGLEGANLRTVAVDANGQMIMVPRGSTGNYMAVDASGNLTTIMKGLEGANLRTLVVDDAGNLIAVMKGLEGANLRTVAVDANGQMIMVPRGSTGNYMSIDADGYMTAVLKGAYGAALRTIGLDDEGRITAYMADGESQWGDIVTVGNAELAARLGSPAAYDWRGQVIWWTNFGHGIGGLFAVESGTGASVELDPTHFLSGGYAVKLIGGSSSAYYADIGVALDVPPADRVGVCVRWCADAEFDYLNLQMQIYDGARYHEAFIRYDRDNNLIIYQDSNRAWQTLAAQTFFFSGYVWHGLKLVVDMATDKYLRCLAGSTEHDMSALGMYNIASATDQRLYCNVRVYSDSGSNQHAWVDSIVITTNEPA